MPFNNFSSAGSSLVTLVNLFCDIIEILIIVRIAISWFPVSRSSPIVQFVSAIVDPLLRPFRRIVPTFGGIDFSPLVAILVINVLNSLVDSIILSQGSHISILQLVVAALFNLLQTIALVFIVLIGLRLLIVALQGDGYHPATMFVKQLTDPLAKPFRFVSRNPNIVAGVALVFYVVIYIVIQAEAIPIIARLP